MDDKNYLSESVYSDLGGHRGHYRHPEELFLDHGKHGAIAAHKLLHDTANNVHPIQKKGDGSLAFHIVTNELGKKGVATKSIDNKDAKINFSHADIEKNHGHSPGLTKTLKNILDNAHHISGNKRHVSGEFLFNKEDVEHHDNHVSFKPNTIKNKVHDAEEQAKIKNAKIGVAMHSAFDEHGNRKPLEKGDIKNSKHVYNMDLSAPKIEKDPETRMHLDTLRNTIKDTPKESFDYVSQPHIKDHIKTYINKTVRDGSKANAKGFIEHMNDHHQKQIDKVKTPGAKENRTVEMHKQMADLHANKEHLENGFKVHHATVAAKDHLVKKIDDADKNSKVTHHLETEGGSYRQTGPEGWTFDSKEHPTINTLKLVNRKDFSRNNFLMNQRFKKPEQKNESVEQLEEGFDPHKNKHPHGGHVSTLVNNMKKDDQGRPELITHFQPNRNPSKIGRGRIKGYEVAYTHDPEEAEKNKRDYAKKFGYQALGEETIKSYSQKQLQDKIKTGNWEATSDIKPGKHVELRHHTGKRVTVHVKEEVNGAANYTMGHKPESVKLDEAEKVAYVNTIRTEEGTKKYHVVHHGETVAVHKTKYEADRHVNSLNAKAASKNVHVKEEVNGPCWKNYKQIGMKKKNGKTVPNCVPESEEFVKESITKTAKRFLQGWEKGGVTPKSIKDRFKDYSDEDLDNLKNAHEYSRTSRLGGEPKKHSPEDLQKKLLSRELKRRGVSEDFDESALPRDLAKQNKSMNEPETTKDKTDIKLPAPTRGGKLYGEIPAGFKYDGKKMYGSMDEAAKHKVMVTVSNPNADSVSTRKETIMKHVKVTAADKDSAIEKAKAFYKKGGYKVHDAEYHSQISEEMNESSEWERRHDEFVAAGNNATDHHVNTLIDKLGKLKNKVQSKKGVLNSVFGKRSNGDLARAEVASDVYIKHLKRLKTAKPNTDERKELGQMVTYSKAHLEKHKDLLESVEQLDESLKNFERKSDHAVMTFGRFSPPHAEHDNLVNAVHKHAQDKGGDAHVFVSHSHKVEKDTKNPLTANEKIAVLRTVHPDKKRSFHASSKESPSMFSSLADLHAKGYKHATVVLGDDRTAEVHDQIKKYNGKFNKDGKGYDFKSINVISRHDIHDTRDTKGGDGVHASDVRKAAKANDVEGVKKMMSPKLSHGMVSSVVKRIRDRSK